MRFGSVEFFKVLIKIVLAILFFVPLILAVLFGVMWGRQRSEVSRLKDENAVLMQDNDKLQVVADVLVGERAGSIGNIREILDRSSVSYEDFIGALLKDKGTDAAGIYKMLSGAGLSDKEIIDVAASGEKATPDRFYQIMKQKGISAADIVKIALKNGSFTGAEYYKLLSDSGMSDSEILALIGNNGGAAPGSSQGTSSGNDAPSESPYAALYPDMYVAAPQEYVYEEGTVYLTFDDGPSANTLEILNYLQKSNVKATWFVVPDGSEWSNERLRAISDAGHVVAVHSRTHEYTEIYASVEAYLKDFYEAWSIIRDATGKTPQIFRFAGGSNNDFNVDTREAIINEMTRRGFRFFDWNVDSGDVMGATWQDMYTSIPRDCHNTQRPIILMHDSKNTYNSVIVLEDIIRVLLTEGYKFDVIHDNTKPVQFVGPFS